MKLLIVIVAFIGAASASNNFGNPCYQCSEFNPQGQGFMAHPNASYCCYYYECWLVQGSTVVHPEILRNCPPGTWWNPNHGTHGQPCIDVKPSDPTCPDECPGGPTPTPSPCPYFAYPENTNQFGPMEDGLVQPLWHCVAGSYFDEGTCTCCVKPEPCFCLADITLSDDIHDDSCMNGAVIESGTSVSFSAAPVPDGNAGFFSGPSGMTHLNDQLFSGLFSQCDKKTCLSVGLFFNAADVQSTQGLVSYGQCAPSLASWQITISGGNVRATIGSDTLLAPINPNEWYYVSFVYKSKTGTFRMYLMDIPAAVACAETCVCPFAVSSMTIPKCAVEPRECGLEIGFTGTSMAPSEFFEGSISRVQVCTKCNMMVCETADCMKKGKRGKWRLPW